MGKEFYNEMKESIEVKTCIINFIRAWKETEEDEYSHFMYILTGI